MFRTHTCGELRQEHINESVTLCGWVQRVRDKGSLTFVDLRDRYGITQLVAEEGRNQSALIQQIRQIGREFVIQIKGKVVQRTAVNKDIPTGQIEVFLEHIEVLNASKTPPFTIEEDTDGGDELRMKYRYLDIRRRAVRANLELRHRLNIETRKYLDQQGFIDVETPVLIKSTPEGARDFIVPSRINPGEFYALPQSPQTFKQLLMVSGLDRYYQIVKCFRDEDLRADRQPEFTQIDCEMAFVDQATILQTFEGLIKHLFLTEKGLELGNFPQMSYQEAMQFYGSDKPDTRFDMRFVELDKVAKGKGFKVFDDAELVAGICASGCADYTRKQLDDLTKWVKRPQIGAKGLVYVKYNQDGSFKSSVDKFFSAEDLRAWADACNAQPGDLLLVLSGDAKSTRKQLGELRLEMGSRLGLRNKDEFSVLWVVDFPLLEWDEDTQRWYAMHHPFTAPKPEDEHLLDKEPAKVRANAYDLVINGVEVGGGSVRIYQRPLQEKMLALLGFTEEEAKAQFGFLMEAFEYGAPPHGGIAFGFDRLCALFGGADSIRDFIAFPKNNSGRDVMIDSPSPVDQLQLEELALQLSLQEKE